MKNFLIILFVLMLGSPAALVYAEEDVVEEFTYDDKGRRDPFWRLVTSSGAVVSYDKDFSLIDLILEGTMSDGKGNSMAIINGNIVKINQRMGNYTVKLITSDTVILTKDNKEFVLKLKKEE